MKRRLKKENVLRAKVDSVIVETLLAVGYEKVRGRRELQNAIIQAVKEWLSENQ